jgi:glycosyltransferase involved in cell wall biosynthesis
MKRLLTIGHSYCVALNRRLPQEIARTGEWDVTVVGPGRFPGDFAWHSLEPASDEPCRVVPIPVRFARRIHVMLYGRRLASLLAEPWDLVHCWEEPYVAAAAQIARGIGRDVPFVLATFQNIDKTYPIPFNWIERYSLKRANGVVAFGRTTAEVLAARGFNRAPVAVIPPGVDLVRFRPDEARHAETMARLGWSDGIPVVGFVGRLVPEKGIELLTTALDRIRTPWRALIIGSGPLLPLISTWASRHADRVRVVTTAQHDDVPGYLNAMDILCAPSQTTPRWREQFGRMLIEAFASGVAVIASTSGEIPHVVDGAALQLAEGDIAAWQYGIEMLTTNRKRRCELARRGRARAEAVYSWPVVAQQHLEFFDRVMAARPS